MNNIEWEVNSGFLVQCLPILSFFVVINETNKQKSSKQTHVYITSSQDVFVANTTLFGIVLIAHLLD